MAVNAAVVTPLLDVCWTDLDTLSAWQHHFAQHLGAAELARAGLFRTALDRSRYIARHGWMREQLAARLGRAPADITFGYNEFGKPHLVDASLGFSVSKSRGIALLVSGPIDCIGCDAEWRDPSIDMLALAGQFFSGAERKTLAALAPAQRLAGFYNAWTRKEAYTKAVGRGLSMRLDTFDVELHPAKPARLLRGCKGWSVASFEPFPDVQAAVVAFGKWQLREVSRSGGKSGALPADPAEDRFGITQAYSSGENRRR